MARLTTEDSAHRILAFGILEAGITEGLPECFVVASGGSVVEGHGHGGPGVCLGDGQTEAEGVPSQGGRGDALLRRMSSYLT